MSNTSSMHLKNTGSKWPKTGWVMACSTWGLTLLGPGPSRSLCGGLNSSTRSLIY